MANIVTVTKIDCSKNGKPRVYFGGKHNWQDAFYVGNKCGGVPMVGASIEADTTSKTFDDGRTTWFLNGWKAAANGAAQHNAPPLTIAREAAGATYGAPQQMQPVPVPYVAPKGWDIPTGDLSRFASNIVGQAITAGLVKTPNDVAPWTAAAYRAAETLRSGKIRDFDDPIPDMRGFPDGPDPSEDQGYGDDVDPEIGF